MVSSGTGSVSRVPARPGSAAKRSVCWVGTERIVHKKHAGAIRGQLRIVGGGSMPRVASANVSAQLTFISAYDTADYTVDPECGRLFRRVSRLASKQE